MTATIQRLQTDANELWGHYNAVRTAFLEHPTPALMGARMAAFRPYFIKLVGEGWQERIAQATERERNACVTLLNAARLHRGING